MTDFELRNEKRGLQLQSFLLENILDYPLCENAFFKMTLLEVYKYLLLLPNSTLISKEDLGNLIGFCSSKSWDIGCQQPYLEEQKDGMTGYRMALNTVIGRLKKISLSAWLFERDRLKKRRDDFRAAYK